MSLVGAFENGGTPEATGQDPYNMVTPDVNGNVSAADAVVIPQGDPTRATQTFGKSFGQP
ncbi:MAG: hypothetical protein VYC19_11060 [Pseudomonadota bacterium]|jgi:hypothetical protein|nr:hypothetical protein [Alphaproteobacteria bacterium]MEC7703282.1 hypothetical protein [Pseudomonadota bacterium]MEE3322848.1 hypothetical protein [Pseudomonadota bacterium]